MFKLGFKLTSLSVASALVVTFLLPASAVASETVDKLNDLMSRDHVSREIVFEIQDGVDISDTSAFGFGLRHRMIAENIYVLNVPFWLGTKFVLGELLDDPQILVAEPNFIYERTATPDDGLLDQQWGLGGGFGANAFGAWNQGVTGSEEVVIAVIDDGVESNHPDLVNSMWVNPGEIAGNLVDEDDNGLVDDVHGWDFVLNTGDVRRDDSRFSHGTHVAGIIAAQSNNVIGVSGVAPGVKIMALTVFGLTNAPNPSDPQVVYGDLGAIVAAFHYVSNMKQNSGVNIVATNNSYGGGYSENIKRAMDRAGNLGILHVAAAGNSSFDNDSVVSEFYQVDGETVEISRSFPASYQCYDDSRDHDCVISVASTEQNGEVSGFSNVGEFSVDMGAPGGAILSTVPLDYQGPVVQPGYAVFNGTSMAAPFVAGAIALCASANPSLSPGEIRSKLMATAKFNPDIFRWATTDGVLDISALVTSCLASVPTLMTGAPANLVAEQTLDPGHVKLSWDDNVSGEDGFVVRWGIKVGGVCAIPSGNIVAFLAPGTTSFVDAGYVTGETYCLKVEAFRGETQSAAATSAELPIRTFDTVIFAGRLMQHRTCLGVAGVKISFSATGYPDSYAYADNDPVLSCDGYAEDGFFSILVPRNVQGTLTFEGPNSVSKTALTTFPPTPADLEVQIPFELRENMFVFADLPNYHQISLHATDRLSSEDVEGARLSASLISGESFGCAASAGFYYPLITSVDDAEDVTYGTPVCSYNPASANGEALTTDRLGLVNLYVLDTNMQNSTSQLRVTLSEPGGGPRFGQTLVSTSQPSTLEISLLSVPGAPVAPVVTPGPAQLSVGLAAPSDNGGLEVSSYSVFTADAANGVFSSVQSGTCSGLVSPSLATCTITNLPGGVERFVKVAANNAIGSSVASSASSGTPEQAPVVVTPPTSGGGGGGGGGGFFPAPVTPADPIASNPFTATTKLTALDGNGNPINLNRVVSADKRSLSLEFGAAKLSLSSTAGASFTDSGRLSAAAGSSITVTATGYQPDSLISGYLVPVANLTTASFRFFSSAPISLGTATVDQDGRFNFAANLGSVSGIYALQLSGTALGGQKADLLLETQIGATSSSGSSTWAKRMVGNSQAKLYAKNIVGSGKVSFRVNGKEIAFVNASSTSDRKLRLVGNDNYLVRTINLVKGKNVLEVFVDGKRTIRTVYSR